MSSMGDMVGYQLPLTVFLKDPVFRKWFAQMPTLVPSQKVGKPWWVYVQKREGGPWQRASVSSYAKGYKWIGAHLKQYDDFALTSRVRSYLPPVWRPVRNGRTAKHKEYWAEYPRSHNWCPYCRRPVIFDYFEEHHADTIRSMFGRPSNELRCTICGITESGAGPWMRLGHSDRRPSDKEKAVKV